jgi:hypothetical protein
MTEESKTRSTKYSSVDAHEISTLIKEVNQFLGDAQRFNEIEVSKLLEEIFAIDPSHPDLVRLHLRAKVLSDENLENKMYNDVRNECAVLWGKEDEYVKAQLAGEAIINLVFRPAVDKVKQLVNDNDKFPKLKGLLNEAEGNYDSARRRYEAKSTADQTKEYDVLLKTLREQDANKLIPWKDDRGQTQKPVTVAEAIRISEKIAQEFAHTKAQEYYRDAIKQVEAHEPRTAANNIQKGLDLFMIGDTDKIMFASYYEKNIEPLLQELVNAEKELDRALELGPKEGWTLIRKVAEKTPWVGKLNACHHALAIRLISRAEVLLEDSEKNLEWYKENFAKDKLQVSKSKSSSALELINLIVEYVDRSEISLNKEWDQIRSKAHELGAKISSAVQLCEGYEKEIVDLSKYADLLENALEKGKSTDSLWKSIAEKYKDDRIKADNRLHELRLRTEMEKGIKFVLSSFESIFLTGQIAELEKAINDCRAILKEVTGAQDQSKLQAMQQKIQIRLRYLKGLKQYENGDISGARKEFEWVIKQEGHIDTIDAKVKIAEIIRLAENEANVEKTLAQADAIVSSEPKRAYDFLFPIKDIPSTYKKEVLNLLGKSRTLWEKQKIDELKNVLKLENPDAIKIFTLVKELLDELESKSELVPKALARAHALEAQTFADAENWDAAEEAWRKAQGYDSLDVNIQNGWQIARLQQIEIILENSSDINLDDVFKGVTSTPFAWEIQARFYFKKANSYSLMAGERINFYIRASQSIDLARELSKRQMETLVRQKTDRSRLDELDKNLILLKKKVDEGENLARKQINIENKLHNERGRDDFEQAVKDAEKLIKDNLSLKLDEWWQNAVRRAVNDLLQLEAKLTQNDIWERFDIQSKIQAIDPNHASTQLFRRQLPGLVRRLQIEIDQKTSDRTGSLNEDTNSQVDVVSRQESDLLSLQNRAQVAYVMLKESQDDGSLVLFNQRLGVLESFIKDISFLNLKIKQAKGFVESAKQDDSWNDFDRLIGQINQEGFGNHRSVNALNEMKNRIKIKRKQLEDLRRRIVEYCEDKDGRKSGDALALMDIFLSDQQGDPMDEYGLRATLEFTPPVLGGVENVDKKKIGNWFNVEGWLKKQRLQLESLQNWLIDCGLIDLINSNSLVLINMKTGSPRGIVKWNENKEAINEFINSGSYKRATYNLIVILGEKISHDAKSVFLQDKKNILGPDFDILPLMASLKKLSACPIGYQDAISKLTLNLLKSAEEIKAELQTDIADVKKLMKVIEKKEKAWEDAENGLNHAFRELQHLVSRKFLLRREQKITTAINKVRTALQICEKIAPHHPNLQGIKEHFLLKGG